MKTKACLLPKKGLDDRLATVNWGLNSFQVATLRSLYKDVTGTDVEAKFLTDGKTLKNLTLDDLREIRKTLKAFHEGLAKKERKALDDAIYNPTAAYIQLDEAFSPMQRNDRVGLVADIFMSEVDALEKKLHISRERIICGYIDENNEFQYGPSYLVSQVRAELSRRMNLWRMASLNPKGDGKKSQEECRRIYAQYGLMIQNLGALMILANKVIKDSEGVNIGAKLHFAVPSTLEDSDVTGMSFEFNIEEQTRESWQQHKDNINPFTSLSKEVRRLLGRIREFSDEASPKYYDDLGNPKRQRASRLHLQLAHLFSGVESEEDVINRLRNANPREYPYAKKMLEEFEANPLLVTDFYIDFSKIVQYYAKVNHKGDNGAFLQILNRVTKKALIKEILPKIKNKEFYQTEHTIFNYAAEGGIKTNIEKVKEAINFINNLYETVYFDPNGNVISKEQYDKDMADSYIDNNIKSMYSSSEEITKRSVGSILDENDKEGNEVIDLENSNQRELLYSRFKQIADYFGMPFDTYVFSSIVGDKNQLEKFNETAKQLAFALTNIGNENNFLTAIDKIKGANGSNVLLEAMSDLYLQVLPGEESEKVLDRIRFQNKDYHSWVQSSDLGRLRDKIKNCFRHFNRITPSKARELFDANLKQFTQFYDSTTNTYKIQWINDVLSGKKKMNTDQVKLKVFLLRNYGISSYYYDAKNDKFNTQWLYEAYRYNGKDKNNFARNFDYFRLLGDDLNKFEDFAEQAQEVSNLAGFFNHYKKGFAYFPTFILGDSGIQKYIQAPVYNEKQIIKGLIDATMQDINLYKQLVAQKKVLEAKFEEYYENLSNKESVNKEDLRKSFLGTFNNLNTENIFALVPMLNGTEVAKELKTLVDKSINASTKAERDAVEEELKGFDIRDRIEETIKSKLLTDFQAFRENLANDGLFATRDKGGNPQNGTEFSNSLIRNLSKKYLGNSNVDSFYTDESALNKNLWDFFLNSKFAMINQVQLTVGSPAFFNGGLQGDSVEFQKRYKQIHASGNVLSNATNPFTHKKYSESFSQKIVYVNDPRTSVEDTNPEYYEALQEFDRINGTNLADKYSARVSAKNLAKATDGQSWRTLDSYMAIMGMSGKMTPELWAIWQRVNKIRNNNDPNNLGIRQFQALHPNGLTAEEAQELKTLERKKLGLDKDAEFKGKVVTLEELEKASATNLTPEENERYEQLKEIKNGITRKQAAELEECKVALQPIKSIITSFEKLPNADGTYTMMSMQIKHSECVIIPELLPRGSKLREMMEWAEDINPKTGQPNADMISSDSTVKVGLFGSVDIQNCTKVGDITNSLKGAYVHNISNEGYVIQQNNSDHINEDRAIGTQGRKIVFANLNEKVKDRNGNLIPADYIGYLGGAKSFMLNGTKYTRANNVVMNQFYVGINAANILEDIELFKQEISDPKKLRDALIQMNMNSDRGSSEAFLGLSEAGFKDNHGNYQPFLKPLFEGSTEYDNAAFILSMFRNRVNKQKMAGGSAIQASAYGLSDMTETDNLKFVRDPFNPANILYAEAEMPFDLKYIDANGDEVELQWNDWLETDGRPKLSEEIITKDDPRYTRYLSFRDSDGNVHIPLLEQEFPGILDIIGTRIPTENKYSMMPLKVTRFSHKIANGGTIKLPLHTVTIAGWDFD